MRLVLAHGFTQTARSWDVLTPALRAHLATDSVEDAEIVAADLPGHGTAGELRRELWGCADHLVEVGGDAIYIGYSMGGRIALHAALAHPAAVRGLVLIGATPGIASESERCARRAADRELADRLERIGVDAFLDEWLALPLFAGLDASAAMRDDRLRNRAADLASSLRLTGTGSQSPLWDRLRDITAPALVIVGANDQKFNTIGRQMCSMLPSGEMISISDAGHSAHLEQPNATAAVIADWVGGRVHNTASATR
ncbi:MAG: alpha/beta fold hydrolase [Actinomycetota bacterium]